MKAKRYDLIGPGWRNEKYTDVAEVQESESGEFVKFEDYERLTSAADELEHLRTLIFDMRPYVAGFECADAAELEAKQLLLQRIEAVS